MTGRFTRTARLVYPPGYRPERAHRRVVNQSLFSVQNVNKNTVAPACPLQASRHIHCPAHLGDVTGVAGAAKHFVHLRQLHALVVLRMETGNKIIKVGAWRSRVTQPRQVEMRRSKSVENWRKARESRSNYPKILLTTVPVYDAEERKRAYSWHAKESNKTYRPRRRTRQAAFDAQVVHQAL